MARTQLRTKVAVVTTTVGLAVLLAGPTSTFGLGVPGADSVTTQVTSTVESTQQTAATTVTQVESTLQTTAQTVAPTPAAPPPAPTPSAPAQTVTRAAAPVKKQAAAVAAPRTSVQRQPATTRAVSAPARSVTDSVRQLSQKRTTTSRIRKPALRTTTRTSTSTTSGDEPPAQCSVPLLGLLPGGAQLQALVAIACNAASGLDLGARIGLTPSADSTAPASGLHGTSSRGPSAPVRARSASFGPHAVAGVASRPGAVAASAGRVGRGLVPLGARTTGRAGAIAYVNAVAAADASATAAPTSDAAAAKHHHHTWFSGQSRGTELLLAIIFASIATLGGIVLWRLAARFVVPRFA
jgi:hypothetical protein